MLDRLNNATPAVSQIEHSDNPARQVIDAELIGADTCTALGMTVKSSAPVLAMCRELVAAGHDPAARLEAYRGNVLCLRVRSIGAVARLEINTKGTGFVTYRAVRAASPVGQNRRRAS